ncbi:MAG: hypothetical protein GYA22_11945 [Bacteroidales bacterium]|nr:hypothetical protein [Bacteroidales bacterium]
MAFAEKWRYGIGESILKKRLKNITRTPVTCNLNQAKNVGILFDATLLEQFDPVRTFIASLQDKGIQVQVIGYVNDKKIHESYLLRRSFHFFSKKELTWFYKPTPVYIDEFIRKPFDILLCLYLKDYFPLRYITALSNAHFKVGLFSPANTYLDFMIDMGNNCFPDMLIDQIKTYVGDLKTRPCSQNTD